MSTEDSGALVRWYSNRIGEPATGYEAYGYWLFVIGVFVGVLGIVSFLLSESSADLLRGAGYALSAMGLLLLVAGPIMRLRLRRYASYMAILGVLVGYAAIVWFLLAYPEDWVRPSGAQQAKTIISVYAAGLGIVALGGIAVPLVTGPHTDEEEAELREKLEAERRDRIEAEERIELLEEEREEAAADREAAEAAADEEAAERERIEAELRAIRESQSQFELYEDAAGEHRWRLRHRNGNVIATGGEGYASRQKVRQGLAAVRRDAHGAAVVALEPAGHDVSEADEATEGEDAPPMVAEAATQATYELFADNQGKYRWRLRHANGEIVADSGQGYAASGNVERAVDRVRAYAQSADFLRVDPVAFELYRDTAGEWRWRLIHENGENIANGSEGYSSRTKARQGIESVRSNAPEGGDAEFETYEDNRGKYRWRLRHRNGEIIADSGQGYASEQGVRDAIVRIREYAPDAPHLDIGSAAFEIYEDAGEEWRWRLRHRNGNTLADSGEGYTSRSSATEAVQRVKRHAPNADREWEDAA